MPRKLPVPEPVAALNAANRAYEDALRKFHAEENHLDLMRQMLREFSSVPLRVIVGRPYRYTMDLFPELVLNLCQGNMSGIHLARDIIRTLPKTDVEQRVVADLEALVEGMIADEVAQLSDLLIEFGLPAAVERVASYAAAQPDPEMHRLADDLDGIEHTWRWRLSRTERIRRRG